MQNMHKDSLHLAVMCQDTFLVVTERFLPWYPPGCIPGVPATGGIPI